MNNIKQIAATTNGINGTRKLPIAVLQRMFDFFNGELLVISSNEDPRVKPIARIFGAELVDQGDGESTLYYLINIFSSENRRYITLPGKQFAPMPTPIDATYLVCSSKELDEQKDILYQQLGMLLRTDRSDYFTNATMPCSGTLVIFFFGVHTGQLCYEIRNRIGRKKDPSCDDVLTIVESMTRPHEDENNLFILHLTIYDTLSDMKLDSVTVLATPTIEELHSFFTNGLIQLDLLTEDFFCTSPPADEEIVQLVTSYSHGILKTEYYLNAQAIPVMPVTREVAGSAEIPRRTHFVDVNKKRKYPKKRRK